MLPDKYGAHRFYGVYRGIVIDSNDPLEKHRLKVQIPQVIFEAVTDWIWPSNTLGIHSGPPSIGQGVWVQFEGGDPSFPVWTGIFGDDESTLGSESVSLALDDLTDVDTAGVTDGQVIKYDSATHTWKPGTGGGGSSVTALDDLTDVNAPSPSNGQVLTYNSSTHEWISAAVPQVPVDGALGYWGSFWSTSTQTTTGSSAVNAVTLNTTDPDSNGVSIISSSHITFAYAGTYNIQFSAQVYQTSNGSPSVDFWLRLNGTDIPQTTGTVDLSNQMHYALPAWNYILNLSAGDYLQLMWAADTSSVQLSYKAAQTSPHVAPATPSVILTAQQVMYTQVGPAGPGVPTGGTTGQVLSKVNGTDYNTHWVTPITNAVTSITAGTNLTGGTITTSGTIALSATPTGITTINGVTMPTSGSFITSSTSAGGDLTGTYPSPTLAATTVTAASYGSASSVATFTVDSKGRLTAASSTAISIANTAVSGLGTASTKDIPVTGNASTSQVVYGTDTRLTDSRIPSGSASGDLTGTYPSPTLAATTVTAASYGSSSSVATFTVDSKGRLTAASSSAIAIANTAVSGLGTASTKDIPATGNASTSQVVYGTDTRLTDSRTPSGSASGDLTGTYPSPTLAALSPSPAGTYGSATAVPAITVDAKGRVTSVTSTSIAISASQVTSGLSGTYAPLASPSLTGTPLSTTATVDTNTTQIATTAFVLGQASASGDGTPAMDGTASRGTSTHYARADHVHPTDTSRSPLAGSSSITTVGTIASGTWNGSTIAVAYGGTGTGTAGITAFNNITGYTASGATGTTSTNIVFSASPTFTGTPLSTTAAVDTNTTQIATTAFVLAQAASATPIVDGTAAVGTSTRYARADHVHPTDTSRASTSQTFYLGTTSVAINRTSASLALTGITSIDGSAASVANALTISSPLSGTSYNGSSAVSIGLSSAYGDSVNPYGTKTANTVLAGPSSGSAATPTFRTLVSADLPSIALSSLSDVIITSLTNTQLLQYNSTSGKWVNASPSITTASNLSLTGSTNGAIPYQTAATTTSYVAAGTSGYILKANGAAAPSWIQSVPVANGGTGATDAATARTNLGVTDPGDTGIPYRTAAGQASPTLVSGSPWSSASLSVTLPSSRFSVAPRIIATVENATAPSLIASVSGVSSSSFTLRVSYYGSSTNSITTNWIAIQMTSGAASG
jgi:hypothetical protein